MGYQSSRTGAATEAAITRAAEPVGGGLHCVDNMLVTDIVTSQVFVKVAGLSSLFAAASHVDMPVNGRLRHNNGVTDVFLVGGQIVVYGETTTEVRARIYKNGLPVVGSDSRTTLAGSGGQGRHANLSLSAIVSLAVNDYLELYIANWTSNGDILVPDYRLTAFRI